MIKKTRAKNSVLMVLLTTVIIFFSILIILKNILNIEGSIINADYVPLYFFNLFPTVLLDIIIFSIRKYYIYKKYYNVGVDAICIKIEEVTSNDGDGGTTTNYYPKWEYKYNGKNYQVYGDYYNKKSKIKEIKYLYINPNLVGTGDEVFDLENERVKLFAQVMISLFVLIIILLTGIFLIFK